MFLRFPWILSRRRLVAAVVFDSFLFVVLYNGLFFYDFGRLPNGSIFLLVLWAAWILSSYVFGRYHGIEGFRSLTGASIILDCAVKTTLVVSFSLVGVLAYLWLFKSVAGLSFLQSFLLPYIVYLGILSFLVQSFLGAWLRNKSLKIDQWHFLGTPEHYRRLKYNLRWSRLPVVLNYLDSQNLNEFTSGAIVVDDFASQASTVISLLLKIQQGGCTVISRQDWCEVVLQRFPPEFLGNFELLRGDFSFPGGTFQSRLKRLGDLSLSAFLLLLTTPIVLISALMVKAEDGGPIFYSQVRTGLNGIPYTIYKLRTMRVDAEQHGARWVKRADVRVTRIGAVLRKTRIDELPQLWCVFSGAMSLIGPRPERPEFDRKLEQQIHNYNLRYQMRPGLSGWAQVNYPYGASVEDSANKLSYDLYYLRNFSFFLDLLILFKTIRLVFNAQGALPSSDS